MLYGKIQRAFIGVTIREVDAELADELELSTPGGVYVSSVSRNSGAEEAGIEAVILFQYRSD